jgi:peptidyl-prolyl cis-trans isomerase D
MAKETRKKTVGLSKKHLARKQREDRQVKIIVITSIVVILLVVGILAYGYLDQHVLKGRRAVITVNDEEISVNEFRAFTKYYRYTLIRQAENTLNLIQMFGPEMSQSFTSQLTQIQDSLDPFRSGQIAIDQLVDSTLIRQEAIKRGFTVSQEEIDAYAQEVFGYFPDGTPTPSATPELLPTSTLSSLQKTMLPPTATVSLPEVITDTVEEEFAATPTQEVSPTATQVLTPTATATQYTFDAFKENYDETIKSLKDDYEIPEETFRFILEAQLYQKKLFEEIIGDKECTQEQVWAQHILVEEEDLAKDIQQRIMDGEDWSLMAVTYSTDESNKNNSGDLGWFSRGQMVQSFEDIAFTLQVGKVSGPVQTDYGWHIIRVIGHEDRPLSTTDCTELENSEFQNWLKEIRDASEIDIKEDWQENVPLLPAMPEDMTAIINSLVTPQENSLPSQ